MFWVQRGAPAGDERKGAPGTVRGTHGLRTRQSVFSVFLVRHAGGLLEAYDCIEYFRWERRPGI